MSSDEPITLTRDVEAAIIPVGDRVTLQKGEQAYITQTLGGSYTVIVNGNMFRIEGKDADALGLEAAAKPASTGAPVTQEHLEKEIWNQLRSCYDPEIPVNIVDLGLIYDCHITPLPAGSHQGGCEDDADGARLRHGPDARAGCAEQSARPGGGGRCGRGAGLGPALEPGHDDRSRPSCSLGLL